MRIREAAEASGLGEDTIRFYEKAGMLPEIPRDRRGHRQFTPRLIEWLTLLYWLRETGMTMKQMQRFTSLALADADGGTDTIDERRQILIEHSARLKQRRSLLDKCEAVLAIKIESYGAKEES